MSFSSPHCPFRSPYPPSTGVRGEVDSGLWTLDSGFRRRRPDRGVALLLALLVLTILIVLVGQIVLSTAHSRSVSENAVADLQNSYGVKAAYAVASEFILADAEKQPNTDSLDEKWAESRTLELGVATVSIKVSDSERRINLAMMVTDQGETNGPVLAQVRRLLTQLGHEVTFADRILDYQDKDAKGDYESGARNERLFNLEELQRIEGMKPEVLFGDETRKGILDFVTVWPRGGQTAGKINLNTAPVEVLKCLDDEVDDALANAIVSKRQQPDAQGQAQPFQNVAELQDVDGMTPELYAAIQPQATVKATAFEIRARSKAGAVEKRWVYVVARESQGGQGGQPGTTTLKLVATMREHEFLELNEDEKP